MRQAIRRGTDLLMLNSDAILYPNAIAEMHACAYSDVMIGYVSPRSNNATLCSMPAQERFHHTKPAEAYENFLDVSARMPRFTYVPTAVGFCMYVKYDILEAFGTFDEIYERGYCEENDLVMRGNRLGFRSALANWAFVYHQGEASFTSTPDLKADAEKRHAAILAKRYREYFPRVQEYFRSSAYRAEVLLGELVPDADGRIRVCVDVALNVLHNGTSYLAGQMIRALQERHGGNCRLFVRCSKTAFDFHKLRDIEGISHVDPLVRSTYGAWLRIGPPFVLRDLWSAFDQAAVVGFFMLDTIAYDCQYLNEPELDDVWSYVESSADFAVYNSKFTRGQFARRFRRGADLIEKVSLHSLDPAEYRRPYDLPDRESDVSPARVSIRGGLAERESGDVSVTDGANSVHGVTPPAAKTAEYLMVMGNDYHHKGVASTLRSIADKLPDEPVVSFGDRAAQQGNCRVVQANRITDEALHALYCGSSAIIVPSYYEGFGFPLLEAFAYDKPIYLRRLAVYQEILTHCGYRGDAVHFYNTDQDLIEQLKARKKDGGRHILADNRKNGWARSADEVYATIGEARAAASYDRVRTRLVTFAFVQTAETKRNELPIRNELERLARIVSRRVRAKCFRPKQ
ncbi:MAG: glycosyltransferase [Capsulimonadaceae bacterium]